MNSRILLAALALTAFGSCTSTYKSSQTPDDVYYSPVRVLKEETRKEDDNDQAKKEQAVEDRDIRNRIRDKRYRDFDNDYSYDYNYNTRCNCYCNHYGYGYYNHPYYYPTYYYNPKYTPIPVNTTPRMVNLNAYTPQNTTVVNNKTGVSTQQPRYNNSNRNSGLGNVLRKVFTPVQNSSNNNSSSGNNNTRTYQPSSSSSNNSGSSSGSSSSGTVSRPVRGGK